MVKIKKQWKQLVSLLMALILMGTLTGCSGANDKAVNGTAPTGATGSSSEKVVNIGVTSTLATLNPITMNGGLVNKYATEIQFLPLVELDDKMNFEYLLADSITTKDNINFIIHINDKATWSDGTPITSDDVLFTALRMASPVVANPSLMYYAFVGVGDDGYVKKGATSIDGIKALDDKTVQFTTKNPMALTTFENTYAAYMLPLPAHILKDVPEDQIATYDWFNHPDVVSGPFRVTAVDVNHYISYVKNDKYWKGEPKLDKLNIKIVQPSQLYAGLKSGELDFVQQTTGTIPQEDYKNVEALKNVTSVYGTPITNQSVFIQTQNKAVSDARVRQAILYAIDRNQLVSGLLKGKGEVVDGFLSSAGPFYDPSLKPIEYNPGKAKELLSQAGWDGSQTLRFYVDSGDATFVNAASVIAAQLLAVGIKVDIKTVDFATLMTVAGTKDYDLLGVQYTYAPVDPYPDVSWLLSGESSWTGYSNDKINAALAATQTTSDVNVIKQQYLTIDQIVQQDVPMFSAYVISALGAVNNRLVNATPAVYGSFNNLQDWDVTQ